MQSQRRTLGEKRPDKIINATITETIKLTELPILLSLSGVTQSSVISADYPETLLSHKHWVSVGGLH